MVRTSAYLASFAFILGLAFALPLPSAQPLANNPTDVMLRADFPSVMNASGTSLSGHVLFFSLNGTTSVHLGLEHVPVGAWIQYGLYYENCKGPIGEPVDFDSKNPPVPTSSFSTQSYPVGNLAARHGFIKLSENGKVDVSYYDNYLSLNHPPMSRSPEERQTEHPKTFLKILNGDRVLGCAPVLRNKVPSDLLFLAAVKNHISEIQATIDRESESYVTQKSSMMDTQMNFHLPPFMSFLDTTTLRRIINTLFALMNHVTWDFWYFLCNNWFLLPLIFGSMIQALLLLGLIRVVQCAARFLGLLDNVDVIDQPGAVDQEVNPQPILRAGPPGDT